MGSQWSLRVGKIVQGDNTQHSVHQFITRRLDIIVHVTFCPSKFFNVSFFMNAYLLSTGKGCTRLIN